MTNRDRIGPTTPIDQALRREQHLATIVDNAHDAIVSKDLAGPIVTWNDAATRMYGHTAEEAVGRPIDILIPDDDTRRAEELGIRASIARGERIDNHHTVRRRKDGSLIEVSLSIVPVRDDTGAVVGAAGIARDLSRRRRLELEPADGGRLLDHLAHDIRAPMQHILNSAQDAVRLSARGARVDELLGRIVTHAVWISQRTEGLLRAGAPRDPRRHRWTVDAGRVFDDACAILRSVDESVRAAVVHRGELPTVCADRALLSLLFQNLLQHTCRSVEEPAVVSVTADRYGRGWRFTIGDDGRGTGRPDRTGEAGAAGLRLGLCRRIVAWHGGRIRIGPGATMSFTIPDVSDEPG